MTNTSRMAARHRGWFLALMISLLGSGGPVLAQPGDPKEEAGYEWLLPSEKAMLSFKDQKPITFVTRNQNATEWDKLPAFWNESTEKAIDPRTRTEVVRPVVKIKVPLGLTQPPPIPPENPPTVAKWALGKQLYFDEIISSDLTVSCATCHDPKAGYTTNTKVSTGISNLRGGMNAPTVVNSAYNLVQFWDGRAGSLELQSQGPPQNPVEMFDGKGHAWNEVIRRVRKKPEYNEKFLKVFGTLPTRDGIAKAIATYERTVLSGNSIHDRAELAMRARVAEEESTNFTIQAKDYEKVLNEARKLNDKNALSALNLDAQKDAGRIPEVAKQIANGRTLFFGKARCNSCHVGDNFTDNSFHNLGVGALETKLAKGHEGRFAVLDSGHKNPEFFGAFKTPTLRALRDSGPYMHDGSEDTLEKVVELYDRGGNPNEYLDVKMRDLDAEAAFAQNVRTGTTWKGPKVYLCGSDQKPIIPLKLNLTKQEQQDLVLFMRALQGDPIDPIVADKTRMPPAASSLGLNR